LCKCEYLKRRYIEESAKKHKKVSEYSRIFQENWEKHWEKLGKVGKSWEKLGKHWENWKKLGKRWENWEKLEKTLGKLGKLVSQFFPENTILKFQRKIAPISVGVLKQLACELES